MRISSAKKAISPLVSSILLISFAIVLGMIVMSWGKTTAATTVLPEICEGASLNVIKIAGEEQICYKEGNIYATIENNGAIELAGINANIIGDGITSSSADVNIKAADVVKVNMPYSAIGGIKQIRLAPKLKDIICAKNIIAIEDIKTCGE